MKKALIFICIYSLLTGCKKEEIIIDNTPQLLQRSWKMTAWDVITPLQGTPLDGQSPHWYSQGCYSNMVWTYKNSGNLIIEDDPICIASGTTGIHNSTWKLSLDNKKIEINGNPFGEFTYSIISITEKKLTVQRLEKVGYNGGGIIELLIQREYDAQ